MSNKHLSEDEIRYTVDVKTAAAQKEIYKLEQQTKKLRSENKVRLNQMIQLEAAGRKESETYKNLKKQYTDTGKEIRTRTSDLAPPRRVRYQLRQIPKTKKDFRLGKSFFIEDPVTRMGLEPMTPTLKVLCSTS